MVMTSPMIASFALLILHNLQQGECAVGVSVKPGDNLVKGGVTVRPTAVPTPGPSFVSEGKHYRVNEGGSIVLPCQTHNTGVFKQAWKRGIAILTAGSVKVSPDDRLKLMGGGYDLEIRGVTPQDAGDYVCQIATLIPMEITHTLTILVPPKILQVTSGGLVEVKKGSKVTLECPASGNPPPTITWTRKNNLVMEGEKSIEGVSLTLEQTNRHNAGVYICTADNGVGIPVSRQITLNILYAPEIEVERAWVHSGVGYEAQLVCIIHAHPPAEVLWYRSTLRLEPTERRLVESRGSRHSLIIRQVQPEDFANYTCQADNAQGKTRQHIILSGKPHVGVFKSPQIGKSRDSYNISWSVSSYTPIDEFKLYFRKQPIAPILASVPNPSSSQRRAHRRDNSTQMREWTDVVLPGPQRSGELIQEMYYLIRGLEPSTQYEARVQARNSFGWNQISDTFRFSTRGMDGISREPTPEPAILPEAEMRDLGVTAQGKASSQFQIPIVLLLISAIPLVLNT